MTHARFQMYNVTGAALWVIALVTGGYFFGNMPVVRDHLTVIVLVGVGAAVVPLALGGLYKFSRRVISR
jgi:membrane-associated protein